MVWFSFTEHGVLKIAPKVMYLANQVMSWSLWSTLHSRRTGTRTHPASCPLDTQLVAWASTPMLPNAGAGSRRRSIRDNAQEEQTK